jgi:teichuronic acid exporter
LFTYGYKLLIAGLSSSTFNEIYNASIRKLYSAQSLGYYTNAKKLSDVASSPVSSILHQVTFPILASLQADKDRMIAVYVRLIRVTAFFIFPLMTLFALLADPLIRLLLTNKWEASIPLLQLLCIARIVTPISVINMGILNAIGRSDLFLKVDLSKLTIVIVALVITIPLGVKAIVMGSVITSFIAFFINAYLPGKLFGYGALKQIQDMKKIIFATLGMILLVFMILNLIDHLFLKVILGSFMGVSSYILFCFVLKIEELKEIKALFFK